jgi:hypothetical protein
LVRCPAAVLPRGLQRAPPSIWANGAAAAPCAPQAKTHEKVDSIGEERSIACHAVVMLIRQ